MQAITLCGELATRPGESTKDILRILLEITGQTVLAWQLQMRVSTSVTQHATSYTSIANAHILKSQNGEAYKIFRQKLSLTIEPLVHIFKPFDANWTHLWSIEF